MAGYPLPAGNHVVRAAAGRAPPGPGRPMMPKRDRATRHFGSVPSMSAEAFPDRAAVEWALQNWATAHRKRDDLIRLAVAAGVDTHRIHQITGVAKRTITRITERAAS